MANSERFSLKSKPVIYTRTFVEFYNLRNYKQIHKIYGMIELQKIYTLTMDNFNHLDAHQIIMIFLILSSAYIVSKN